MIISSFFCKTVKCGFRFEPNLIRYSKLRSTVLTRDGWTYRKLNLDLRIQSISELNDEEFKHVTSSAKNFFQHIGSADNSFESLSCLASLVISRKAKNRGRQDEFLNLINDVFFEVNKKHGGRLPQYSYLELYHLARAGYLLRMVDKPYHRDLSRRWMHDILTEFIYPRMHAGELDRDCVKLATRCLIGLPVFTAGFTSTNPQFHREYIADRRKILQSLVDYHRENYAEMTKSDMRLFLHMLYRQAYSPSRYEDLQFMKKVVSEEEEMYRDQSGLLTLLKLDRMYRLLDSDNFMRLRTEVEKMAQLPFEERHLGIDTMMRLCYMLAEKSFVREHTVFFHALTDDLYRNYTSQSKCKHIAMLFKAYMIANHKPSDVAAKKLCTLFNMTVHPHAYKEQLINMSKALVGLDMVHLGKPIICKLLQKFVDDPTSISSAVDLYVIKSLEIEHGPLLHSFIRPRMLTHYLRDGKFNTRHLMAVYFKMGLGSFYNEVLKDALGEAYVSPHRLLPFFVDIDHVFLVDEEGNMLPAHEIQHTFEPIPREYLESDSMEKPVGIPEESPATGIEEGRPVISKNDILFAVINSKLQVKKTWTRRKGHLIYLTLRNRDDTGQLFGVCAWQIRLTKKIRPPVNVFEIDQSYISSVSDVYAREDARGDNKLREECIQYIQKTVQYAIETTLTRHKQKVATEHVSADLKGLTSCEQL